MGNRELAGIGDFVYKFLNMDEEAWPEFLNSPTTPVDVFEAIVDEYKKGSSLEMEGTAFSSLARCKRCPEKALIKIWSEGELWHETILQNPNLGEDFINSFLNEDKQISARMYASLCQNPTLPYAIIKKTVEAGNGDFVFEHPKMTPQLRQQIYKQSLKSAPLGHFFSYRKGLPKWLMLGLAKSKTVDNRRGIAKNSEIDDVSAGILANDEDAVVLKNLEDNRFAPWRYREKAALVLSNINKEWGRPVRNKADWWGKPHLESLRQEVFGWLNDAPSYCKVVTASNPKQFNSQDIYRETIISNNDFKVDDNSLNYQGKGKLDKSQFFCFRSPKDKLWNFCGRRMEGSIFGKVRLPENIDGKFNAGVNSDATKLICQEGVSFGDGIPHYWLTMADIKTRGELPKWGTDGVKPEKWSGRLDVKLAGTIIFDRALFAVWEFRGKFIGWTYETEGAASIPLEKRMEWKEIDNSLCNNFKMKFEVFSRTFIGREIEL